MASTVAESRSIKRLLSSWGLADTIGDKFEAEQITEESLLLLDAATISELIPKAGPRAVFQHHFTQFKNKSSAVEERGIPSTSTSGAPSVQETTYNSLFRPAPQAKRRRIGTEGGEAQRQVLVDEPPINDLHKYLQTTANGLIVLGSFRLRKSLQNTDRDLLSEQAIFKEIYSDFDKKVDRDDFNRLADEIVELFPTESKETWYDLAVKTKTIKKDGRVKVTKTSLVEGRLRFKFYSIRGNLAAANLISKKRLQEDQNVFLEGSESGSADATEEVKRQLAWLQGPDCAESNWLEVETAWGAVLTLRLAMLRSSEIYDYVLKFPCLKNPLGWKLIAADGVKLQDKLKNLSVLWKDYSKILVKLIQDEDPAFTDDGWEVADCDDLDVSLGESSDICNGEVTRFLSILSRLPYLFKVRTIPKSKTAGKKEKAWRPSRKEIMDGVLIHVKELGELSERIQQRKQNIAKYKWSTQPVACVVGELNKIRQSFIVLDNVQWEVTDAFEAVFGVLQMYFGVDAEYPIEARHIWLFLQQTMLDLQLPADYKDDRGLRSFLAGRLKDFERFSEQ